MSAKDIHHGGRIPNSQSSSATHSDVKQVIIIIIITVAIILFFINCLSLFLYQVVTVAHLPERPKDPDADVSNRSDSDTMKSTNSNSSRKVVRTRVWDRVLTANDLVNGESSGTQASLDISIRYR